VKRDRDGGDVSLATVEAPTVLGEMSLITDRPHSATVRAVTTCQFHLLTRSQFDRLLKSENLAAYKVVATLAEVIAWRLSRMDDKVVELARRADCPAPVQELAAFKQKLFSEWNF
jgi:CRP-like cAMP-binding protein